MTSEKRHIYLDHGASTPVDKRVVAAMAPYWSEVYGNTGSSHWHGRAANNALEESRRIVAQSLGAKPGEIIFTGGGSASDNLALRGVMWAARANGGGNHLIVSTVEHPAVLVTAVQLRDLFGFDLTILPVDGYGRINIDDLEIAIRPDTVLISIMAANNEIGTLQPVQEIGEVARAHGILFHTDAVQATAVAKWDMTALPIDLVSVGPHKFYGPKGIGVLYVRDGVTLIPALTGGGQENGRRAGTSNVPLAVGTAEALRLAVAEMPERLHHYEAQRDRLIDGLLTAFPEDCVLTGHPTGRLAHNASFAFRHLSGNDLIMHLDMDGISASSGSACKTGNPKPSAILQAVGLNDEWTTGGLRLTVGDQNDLADIEYTLNAMTNIVPRLYKLNSMMEAA